MLRVNKATNLQFLNSWWEEINGTSLNENCFPPDRFYVIKDEEPVAYFGLHRMECCIGYLGFPTISNAVRRKERAEVYKTMCDCVKSWAAKNGLEAVFISIEGISAQKNLIKCGFNIESESTAKHLFMKV